MMSWQNNVKKIIVSSRAVPAVYTVATKPFAKKMRHLDEVSIPQKIRKISAVIPNYNYARFLPRRIESILSQSYPVSELIILDDASTDSSDKIIKTLLPYYQEKYKNTKIIYRKNTKNTGKPISQWKKAFRLATGDFVWICEADDYCDTDFLASLMPAFEDKSVVISYSNSVAVNDKGKILSYDFALHAGKLSKEHWRYSYVNDGKEEIEKYLKYRCTIPNVSAVVFRNKSSIPILSSLKKAKKFSQVGDWYFYLNILPYGKISFNKSSRNFFRIGQGSATRNTSTKKHQEEIDMIHKQYGL